LPDPERLCQHPFHAATPDAPQFCATFTTQFRATDTAQFIPPALGLF